MVDNSAILEMKDFTPKDKDNTSQGLTPQANPFADSDDDLDELDELDIETTSKWWPSFFRHFFFLFIVEAILISGIVCLVHFGKLNFIEVITSSLSLSAAWDNKLNLRILVWASISSGLAILLSFLLSVIPAFALSFNRLIVPGKIETTKEYIEVFQELRSTFLYSGCITIAFGAFCILFSNSITFDLDNSGVLVTLFRIAFCILVVSYSVTIEKILIQYISVRFHRTAYRQRLDDARVATQILDKLNTAVSKNGLSYSKIVKIETSRAARNKTFIEKEPQSDSETGEFSPDNTTFMGSNASFLKPTPQTSSDRGTLRNLNFDPLKKLDDDPSSFMAARKLARKVFFSLRKNRKQLLLEDFIPWFVNLEEAEKAFNFFDKDKNGDISRREMRDAILGAYKERKDLSKALRDTSQVVGKLHYFFLVLSFMFSGTLCAILFGRNTKNVLISISTFFLGLTFIFGENAKQFFQSIIFLFVMHPYDVGDRIYIDTLQYFVKKVGLLGTEFKCTNGQITYIPHYILITKIIYNARRSEKQVDVIDFQLDYNTPKEKIVELKESVNRYIDEEESREFSSNPLLAIDAIEDCNMLKMFIRLEHKTNWQDNTQRNIRKTRFMITLRDICLRLGLSYSLPVQKIFHQDFSAFSDDPEPQI